MSKVTGSELYPSIFEFLKGQGLDATAKKLLEEAALKLPLTNHHEVSLMGLFRTEVNSKRKREDDSSAPPSKKGAAADSDDECVSLNV